MKSKYLKTYENYKLGYLNDDFFNDFEKEFEKEDNMEFMEEDEVEKDKESEEDAEETDTEETDTQEVENEGEGDEAEDGKIEVSVAIAEYEVDGETPKPAICDPMMPQIDMPISTGFNPSDNFNTMPKAEWCIIKCMTNNGERIGIDQNGTDCEVLCGGLHYDDATSKVEEFARRTSTPAFNNDCDIYLGKISKHFIKKPSKPSGGFDGSGSYKTSM